jgi:acyl-CoA synthetase (NDP forming)
LAIARNHEAVHDHHYLQPLIEPRAVAVIGASERSGSLGYTVIRNLLESGFTGRLFNGGGIGAMAADRAEDLAISLAQLSEETIAALDKHPPPHWSRANPVDLLGDANAERYGKAFQTGPVIYFGEGGKRAVPEHDMVVALPPLNRFLAEDLVRSSRIYPMLLPSWKRSLCANSHRRRSTSVS